MSEKRKDNKGRILKTGESQRKDFTYQYRYTASDKKVRYVYAQTLDKLREKEAIIQRDILDGINYKASEATVWDLVSRYMATRRNFSKNTVRAYSSALNHIKSSKIAHRKISEIKQSDAKAWFASLHDSGMRQHTIEVIQNVLRPAFEMAVNDDALRKNPFKFRISDIIPDDSQQRQALSKQEQQGYLKYLKEQGSSYYYDVVILLGTGLRVSELYGLTKSDIDFEHRAIYVTKQLCRTAEEPYFITSPKTRSGVRTIPMTDDVYVAFKHVLKARGTPRVETIIDGYHSFIFLDKNDNPKVAMHLENHMRYLRRKQLKSRSTSIPNVTPHVLRHTFCTNAQKAGMDVKTLQYLMGHSNVSVTLDVYTHTDFESVEYAFRKVAANL